MEKKSFDIKSRSVYALTCPFQPLAFNLNGNSFHAYIYSTQNNINIKRRVSNLLIAYKHKRQCYEWEVENVLSPTIVVERTESIFQQIENKRNCIICLNQTIATVSVIISLQKTFYCICSFDHHYGNSTYYEMV